MSKGRGVTKFSRSIKRVGIAYIFNIGNFFRQSSFASTHSRSHFTANFQHDAFDVFVAIRVEDARSDVRLNKSFEGLSLTVAPSGPSKSCLRIIQRGRMGVWDDSGWIVALVRKISAFWDARCLSSFLQYRIHLQRQLR